MNWKHNKKIYSRQALQYPRQKFIGAKYTKLPNDQFVNFTLYSLIFILISLITVIY